MTSRYAIFPLVLITLIGCDRLTGEADLKMLDAEAIGFACRVSSKTPENCMKENEAQSPTYILKGWRVADKAILDGGIDPSMKNIPRPKPVSGVASAAVATETEGESHPVEEGADKKTTSAEHTEDTKSSNKTDEKSAKKKADSKDEHPPATH